MTATIALGIVRGYMPDCFARLNEETNGYFNFSSKARREILNLLDELYDKCLEAAAESTDPLIKATYEDVIVESLGNSLAEACA